MSMLSSIVDQVGTPESKPQEVVVRGKTWQVASWPYDGWVLLQLKGKSMKKRFALEDLDALGIEILGRTEHAASLAHTAAAFAAKFKATSGNGGPAGKMNLTAAVAALAGAGPKAAEVNAHEEIGGAGHVSGSAFKSAVTSTVSTAEGEAWANVVQSAVQSDTVAVSDARRAAAEGGAAAQAVRRAAKAEVAEAQSDSLAGSPPPARQPTARPCVPTAAHSPPSRRARQLRAGRAVVQEVQGGLWRRAELPRCPAPPARPALGCGCRLGRDDLAHRCRSLTAALGGCCRWAREFRVQQADPSGGGVAFFAGSWCGPTVACCMLALLLSP